MLLYNVTLGNQQMVPEKFAHIVDEHGNHFIAKDDIRQRMRLDKSVSDKEYPPLGELEPEWSSANMQCYHLLNNVRWANNNKNMNPLLLGNKSRASGNEQIVVYITVMSNYAITQFSTKHRILQTYHKKDTLQGCVIVLTEKEREENPEFIQMKVLDKKKNVYQELKISAIEREPIKVCFSKKNVDKRVATSMKDQLRKFQNRYMGFKIISKPGELLTVTYVTSKKFEDQIKEATAGINNVKIYTIDQEDVDNEEKFVQFLETIRSEITENRIRSITMCGVKFPLNAIRQLKLLYVFNYDTVNNKLSCVKSN